MDITRKLKLLQINGDLDNVDVKEKYFFSLLNNLKLDLVYKNNNLYLNYRDFYINDNTEDEGQYLFYINHRDKYMVVHNDLIIHAVMHKFKMSFSDTKIFIIHTLHKYIGLNEYYLR